MNHKINLYAALAYLNSAIYDTNIGEEDWPECFGHFNPSDYVHNLKHCIEYINKEINRVNKN